MNATRKAVMAWFRTTFMYGVIVPEYKKIHWCWTAKEANEWCEMYPEDTYIDVSNPILTEAT